MLDFAKFVVIIILPFFVFFFSLTPIYPYVIFNYHVLTRRRGTNWLTFGVALKGRFKCYRYITASTHTASIISHLFMPSCFHPWLLLWHSIYIYSSKLLYSSFYLLSPSLTPLNIFSLTPAGLAIFPSFDLSSHTLSTALRSLLVYAFLLFTTSSSHAHYLM